MQAKLKTYLILFCGVLMLSTSAIFVKLCDAPSAVIAFYRLLFAGCMLLPVFLLGKKSRAEAVMLRPRRWAQIVCAGFLLSMHYVLWFESLNYTSTASSTVICPDVEASKRRRRVAHPAPARPEPLFPRQSITPIRAPP